MLSGGLIWGATFIGQDKKPSILSLEGARPEDPALAQKDSDHDGLPDWEEAVRGTNPNNADSDGDGTIDGEEVRLARDPSKAAPGDSLLSKENEQFVNELMSAASSTNLTEDLSQRLFAQYLSALNKGTSGDAQTQEALVQDAVSRAKVPLRGETYTQADLIVVPDTKESTRAFANKTIEAIAKHPNASLMNTVIVFGAAMDDNDKRSKAAFPILGREYQALADDLRKIPVPSSYAASYLQVVNAYEKGGAAFVDMQYYEEDPIRALSGFSNYVQMMQLSVGVLKGLAQKITESGILFTAAEAGSVWKTFLAPSA